MPEYKVTIKAIVSVDNPDTLSKLILCRMTQDEAGEETVSAMDDDFEVIYYPDDWLDFTEIMKEKDDELNNDDTRDIAIRCTDRIVKDGYIKECINTNDETEFNVQDIIHKEINKAITSLKNAKGLIICNEGDKGK